MNNEPNPKETLIQYNIHLSYIPLFTIVVHIRGNINNKYIHEMLDSVIAQSYSNWILTIIHDDSLDKDIVDRLHVYSGKDNRIKVSAVPGKYESTENTPGALPHVSGDYVALLEQNDMLAPFALFELAKAINEDPAADIFYSDEDTISDDRKKRSHPQFKPDWSPCLFRSTNYIAHLTAISTKLLKDIGSSHEDYVDCRYFGLLLRATEKAHKIVHIPKVLYHARHNAAPSISTTALNADTISCRKTISDHLNRLDIDGSVENGLFPGSYKVNYPIKDLPRVSIIIPNHDHTDDLKKCITSIIDKSTYRNFEIIIVDNHSLETTLFDLYAQFKQYSFVKVLQWNASFNYSAINNFAVKHSSGTVLLFLNNDTEVITPDWIQQMMQHALRNEVGAVGAKLYYRDNTVQHGGIILGIDGIVGHAHRHFPRESRGYMGRLSLVHNVSAVTGACLMTRKDVFEAVDGFDEGYPVTFSDVDYCLKLREKGLLIVWTPYAELYHDEFKTRGIDDTPIKKERFEKELVLYRNKWKHIIDKCDPYYSINLSHETEDFSIRV